MQSVFIIKDRHPYESTVTLLITLIALNSRRTGCTASSTVTSAHEGFNRKECHECWRQRHH